MCSDAHSSYIFLFTALLSSAVAFPLGGYSIGPKYSVYLFLLYVLFMVLSCLLESGVVPESSFYWSTGGGAIDCL